MSTASTPNWESLLPFENWWIPLVILFNSRSLCSGGTSTTMFSSGSSYIPGTNLSEVDLELKLPGKYCEHALSSSSIMPNTLKALAISSLQKKVRSSYMKRRSRLTLLSSSCDCSLGERSLCYFLIDLRLNSFEGAIPYYLPTASFKNISNLSIMASVLSPTKCLCTTCS